MTLSEALASSSRTHLACKSCGAHQPVYVQAMIDRHGPETLFETAVKRWDCIFCGMKGEFTVFILGNK